MRVSRNSSQEGSMYKFVTKVMDEKRGIIYGNADRSRWIVWLLKITGRGGRECAVGKTKGDGMSRMMVGWWSNWWCFVDVAMRCKGRCSWEILPGDCDCVVWTVLWAWPLLRQRCAERGVTTNDSYYAARCKHAGNGVLLKAWAWMEEELIRRQRGSSVAYDFDFYNHLEIVWQLPYPPEIRHLIGCLKLTHRELVNYTKASSRWLVYFER